MPVAQSSHHFACRVSSTNQSYVISSDSVDYKVSTWEDSEQLSAELIEVEWHIFALVTYGNIGSDNGLLPVQCQAIILTNADLLSTGPLRINFNEILIKIQ